ncbi:MAG: toll/interleukin-1 receptor domain-containing protein [Bacteroides sp.]|nr:toll/interleukin-1 receptor domain-containing protein [Bacillota bacterium]MCM1394186.1 toll/interleukin-1 receptor domain-containing protein [[Eubacterium] siraeum]MCM1455921.1 toll/interleukin-1 receptor domain-containing protein [Bacteroides sp.]
MSKTYLDRKDPRGSYVFISYSHEDAQYVGKALTALNEYGADFWYDVKLKTGENWINKVEEVVENKNCRGILYFISANFLFSSACLKEFDMYKKLKEERKDFDVAFVLLDEVKVDDLNTFLNNATRRLLDLHPKELNKILQNVNHFTTSFDNDSIHQIVSGDEIDGDLFINSIFKDVFATWGCASDETGKIDALLDDYLINRNYCLKERSRIVENVVNGKDVEWKVFAYSGDTISAILVSDELYDATCVSLAKNAMETINDNIIAARESKAEDDAIKSKHIKFSNGFFNCIKADDEGNVVRYLRAIEHEKNYLQLKDALVKVPLSDQSDDGYFFVQDNQGNLVFADRGSEDVFRHIHVDAYASIIPVIDVDYNKYKEFLAKSSRYC